MAPKAAASPKAAKPAAAKKAPGTGRGMSEYNKFMKSELARLKAADKSLDHKTAFKQAAQNWSKKTKSA